ncbi:hypothetical protein [Acetobacter peroxydans]|uniref:Type IV pilus biogenesis protein PilP n=1 Tax=Acetobacter peroxydans TaxID=104098 RepID=A0A4Y3TX07_9PROT|nr:hypothetical protein [Acetobacter peroxydans]NHO17095.1 hypothetical protein [Acetobacter peroxydans]GBR39626.1 hypothetical protein AA0475_0273 [Acetobacter peroxydans]GEB86294.1 hypothetical protein APE01nite_20910 [Acetobacter peroxydans]
MKKLALISLTTGLLFPAMVQAEAPSCTQHLQEPGPGGRLSQEQIDANNACASVVETQRKISEALAAIADNERREKGTSDLPPAGVRNGLPRAGAPFLQPQPPLAAVPRPAPASMQDRPDEEAPTASVDGVLWEGGTVLTGILRMPDGQSIEAIKGTRLPDGSIVSSITQNGSVVVTRNGKPFMLPSSKTSRQPSSLGNPL